MLKFQYRSSEHHLARDFYQRCLPEARSYGRAVGYFSSNIFAAVPAAFREFFAKDGRMQVVCSHIFSEADTEWFCEGYRERPRLVRESHLDLLDGTPEQVSGRLSALVPWLIAKGYLDLKVARQTADSGGELYHEKLGCFRDDDGNAVVFSGSANESFRAVSKNFEVVEVYRSWMDGEKRRTEQKLRDFECLWSNQTDGLEVCSFFDAARRGRLAVRTDMEPGKQSSDEGSPALDANRLESIKISGLEEVLQIPSQIRLRPHQKEAVRQWFDAEGRGILEMATGSGKTITALACATKLYEIIGTPLVVVMVCPYLHLVDQWIEEAREFGLDPLPCARGRQTWYDELAVRLYNARIGQRHITSFITSNATFRTDAFRELLKTVDVPMLIIGDEAHNLGAPSIRRALPTNASYRLGLSATPERWFDESGTEALVEYFGPTLVHYTLKEALDDDVLCPYRYYPHQIELTDEEFEEYYDFSVQIARLLNRNEITLDAPSQKLERLLISRARLTASAENKLTTLRELMWTRRGSKHNLVYCGDGRVNEPESGIERRQIRAVTRMLGTDLSMQVATYTAETSGERRRRLRRDFARGEIQCLVAIRCLDEGVDIPETRQAFILASSTNPRQFIQRRGRLLRQAEGKDYAEIHDFMVMPPEELIDETSPYFNTIRGLFRKELRRATEFADLAVNGPEAMRSLVEIQDRLNLMDIGARENGTA